MTVSPSEKQDGNRSPDRRPNADRDDSAAIPALPPTLFELPELRTASKHERTSDPALLANPEAEAVGTAEVGAAIDNTVAALGEANPHPSSIGRSHSPDTTETDPGLAGIRTGSSASGRPVQMEEPVRAEMPAPASPPAAAEEHVQNEKFTPTEKPASIEKPAPAEKPGQVNQPEANTRPSAVIDKATPAGRGWVEQIGSQTLVIVLLLAVAGAATLAGGRSDQVETARERPPAETPANSTLLLSAPTGESDSPAPSAQLSLSRPTDEPSRHQNGLAQQRTTDNELSPESSASTADTARAAESPDFATMELVSPRAATTEAWPAASSAPIEQPAIAEQQTSVVEPTLTPAEPTLNPAESIATDMERAHAPGGAELDPADVTPGQGGFIVEPSDPAALSQLASEQASAPTSNPKAEPTLGPEFAEDAQASVPNGDSTSAAVAVSGAASGESASGNEAAMRTPATTRTSQGYRTSSTPNGNIDWLAYLPSRERVAQAAVPGGNAGDAPQVATTETPTDPITSYEAYLRQHAEGYAARSSSPSDQPSYTVPGSAHLAPTPGMSPRAGEPTGVPSAPYIASPPGPSTY